MHLVRSTQVKFPPTLIHSAVFCPAKKKSFGDLVVVVAVDLPLQHFSSILQSRSVVTSRARSFFLAVYSSFPPSLPLSSRSEQSGPCFSCEKDQNCDRRMRMRMAKGLRPSLIRKAPHRPGPHNSRFFKISIPRPKVQVKQILPRRNILCHSFNAHFGIDGPCTLKCIFVSQRLREIHATSVEKFALSSTYIKTKNGATTTTAVAAAAAAAAGGDVHVFTLPHNSRSSGSARSLARSPFRPRPPRGL